MTRVVTRTTRLFVLIDDLQLQALTHKYVDGTTISEVVTKDESSQMQSVVDELVKWSDANYMNMNINRKKTKEMILGPLRRQFPSPLMIADQTVELVTSFKILAVTVVDSLKWSDHIAAVTTKTAKCLWFLKKLKRAGVGLSQSDLAYKMVIGPF